MRRLFTKVLAGIAAMFAFSGKAAKGAKPSAKKPAGHTKTPVFNPEPTNYKKRFQKSRLLNPEYHKIHSPEGVGRAAKRIAGTQRFDRIVKRIRYKTTGGKTKHKKVYLPIEAFAD